MGVIVCQTRIRKESKQIQTVQEYDIKKIVIELINDIISQLISQVNELNFEKQNYEVFVIQELEEIPQPQEVKQEIDKQSSYFPPQEQEPLSQMLQSMIVKKKDKQIIYHDISVLDYSPIQQESKSKASDLVQSVEPFNIDFDSSSESEKIEWNQEVQVLSDGVIRVIGNVK